MWAEVYLFERDGERACEVALKALDLSEAAGDRPRAAVAGRALSSAVWGSGAERDRALAL